MEYDGTVSMGDRDYVVWLAFANAMRMGMDSALSSVLHEFACSLKDEAQVTDTMSGPTVYDLVYTSVYRGRQELNG
jgi:hypothetical protein